MSTSSLAPQSTLTDGDRFLRTVLLWDALGCLAFGLLMTVGVMGVNTVTDIPVGVSLGAGLVLLIVSAWAGYQSKRLSIAGIRSIIGLNAVWIIATAVVVIVAPWPMTWQGATFLLGGAAIVAGFLGLQVFGIRRLARES